MDTPKISDFPDEMDRLAEWRGRRAEDAAERERRMVAESSSAGISARSSRSRIWRCWRIRPTGRRPGAAAGGPYE